MCEKNIYTYFFEIWHYIFSMYLQGIVLISSKLYRSLNIPSSSESVMGNQTFEPGFIMPDRLAEKKSVRKVKIQWSLKDLAETLRVSAFEGSRHQEGLEHDKSFSKFFLIFQNVLIFFLNRRLHLQMHFSRNNFVSLKTLHIKHIHKHKHISYRGEGASDGPSVSRFWDILLRISPPPF